MKKRIIPFFILSSLLGTNVFGAGVVVNNNKIDTEAVIENNRTLVPVRGVFENLGFDVVWDDSVRTATLSRDTTTIIIKEGMDTFTVNGKEITPDVPQQIINNRFYLPLRAVSEAIGAEVEWDSENQNAVVNYYPNEPILDETIINKDTSEKNTAEITVDKETDEVTTAETELSKEETDTNNSDSSLEFESSSSFKGSVNKDLNDTPSYIYANPNGTLTLVSASDKVYVRIVDSDFDTIYENSFLKRNDYFAGYYSDGTYHYIITANNNSTLKPNNVIYSIDKYNNDGNRLGSTSVTNKNLPYTILRPLLAGGVSMAVNGKTLTITDSVDTKKESDAGTQINFSFSYNTDTLTATAPKFYGGSTLKNSVIDSQSLSFVSYGHENYISYAWKNNKGIFASGTEYSNTDTTNNVTIFTPYKDNDVLNNSFTLGGFNVSDTHYILVGTSATQDDKYAENTDFNVFVSSLVKTQLRNDLVRTTYITDYTKDSNVEIENMHLVKINSSEFVLLWQENSNGKSTVKYTKVSSDGSTSEIKEETGITLSNCKPVYSNNLIVWFSINKNNGAPVIQSISL